MVVLSKGLNVTKLPADSFSTGQRFTAQADVFSGHDIRQEHEEVGGLHHQDRSTSSEQRRGQQGHHLRLRSVAAADRNSHRQPGSRLAGALNSE